MSKILLIDDDPDVRLALSRLLQREGYAVETAATKQEALSKLQQKHPDVILLDVLLSGADGRELCRELKAAAATKHIPVIMLSGHPSAAQKFESYGADDFLAKPFNSEGLLGKLSKHVRQVQ